MLSKLCGAAKTVKIRAIYCHSFGITLHQEEITAQLLAEEGLLSCQIINFYFRLLAHHALQDPACPTSVVLDSNFYGQLARCGYEAVSRWTKKVNLFSCDVVLIPIHLEVNSTGHWCCASIHPKEQLVCFYDSLKACRTQGAKCLQDLLSYLQKESDSKYNGTAFDRTKWKTKFCEDLPVQENRFDCGVYICQYAKALSNTCSSTVQFQFKADSIIDIRKEMAIEIRDLKIITLPQSVTPNSLCIDTVPMEVMNNLVPSGFQMSSLMNPSVVNPFTPEVVQFRATVPEQSLSQTSVVKQKRQPKIQPEKKLGFNMKISSAEATSISKDKKNVQTNSCLPKRDDPEEHELSDDFEQPSKVVRNKFLKVIESKDVNGPCKSDIDDRKRAAWDIQGINEDMCEALKETLPDFNHHIVAVQPFDPDDMSETEEDDEDQQEQRQSKEPKPRPKLAIFTAVLRLDIRTKEEALDWLEHYKAASFTAWTVAKTFKEKSPQIVYKKQFKCHHDTRASNPTSKTKNPHEKHINCRSKLMLTVKNFEMQRSTDELLKTYPCEIRIRHWHNHRLQAVKSLKFRKPTPPVVKAFQDMFERGHSPASALLSHKFDLKVKHGENFYQAEADGAQCPSIKWCYYQYYKAFKRVYGANYGPEMIEKLQALIDEYNKSCGKTCAKMHQEGNDLLVVICTPLMQRVHEFLRTSGEIVFMDFSGGMDRYNSRVGCLGTPSVAGGLPLGLILSSSETEIMVTRGLQMLHDVYPEGKAFFGRDKQGPTLFMTDDSTAERNSLRNIYPFAILLLCIFHLLQAFLRYVTNSDHQVKKQDRCFAIDMMKTLVYANSQEELQEKYNKMIESDVVKKNKTLSKHVTEEIFPRAKDWALCYRRGLPTRGNNTNNYMEVMFLQFKNIIFQRVKAFNTVQLFDFFTTRLDGYLESRIASVLNERNPNISLKYRPVPSDKLENLQATQVSKTIYRVTNKKTKGDYIVDMELALCSCFVGNTGAQCKHQYVVAKMFNISTQQFYEFMDMSQKLALHKIMTGNVNVPPGWYADLQDVQMYTENPEEGDQNPSDNQILVPQEQKISSNDHENEAVSLETPDQSGEAVAVVKCKERLHKIFERFNTALDTKPDESLKALNEFCTTIEAKKTDSGLFSSLFEMKNVRRDGKPIKVNNQAVRRRKNAHCGGRKCAQTGRPPKSAFVSEHGYSDSKVRAGPMDPAPPRPTKSKTPHSFSERVNAMRSAEPPSKRSRKC